VPEDRFQFLEFQRRRDPEHSLFAIEAPVRHNNVAVRIEPEEVAEGLDGDDRTGKWFLFRYGLLDEDFMMNDRVDKSNGARLYTLRKNNDDPYFCHYNKSMEIILFEF